MFEVSLLGAVGTVLFLGRDARVDDDTTTAMYGMSTSSIPLPTALLLRSGVVKLRTCRLKKFAMELTSCVNTNSRKPTILA